MKRFFSALAVGVLLVSPAAVEDASPFARALGLAERALADGNLERAREEIRRAQERDPRSVPAWSLRARWAEAAGDRDELVYALHREYQLTVAQGLKKKERLALETHLAELDPIAPDLLSLKVRFIERLEPLAVKYEKDGRPHSAIRVHKEILALDPEHAASAEAIQRIASAPDPSLAGDAKPRDLLADVDLEWIREHDERHATWDDHAVLERDNYVTHTNAGYEVLVRSAEAMEQMNAFYRQFFQFGTEEDGGSVPRIALNIFATRDEYLELGIGPPVEWSAGHFTGGAVETYIGGGGFEETTGTLFHEAAHQFVGLATNAAGWLNEGLASFFEGCRILSNGTVLMNLPASHRLFPLVDRMERGWMSSADDGIDPENPSGSTPEKAPTFRIVLENRYRWGPPWYAPTWGVVYFLYNFEDPIDGRFIYRDAFREFIDSSGGRVGDGAVENFEEVVLANPKRPTKGVDTTDLELPRTVEELDQVWKDWLTRLRKEVGGQITVERPYLQWARYAIQRGDMTDAIEHFEKGLVEDPSNVDLLDEFAEHLADEVKEKDRAAKLVRLALSELERQDPVDEKRIDEFERKLAKLDPKQKTLIQIREDLARSSVVLAQRYLGEELYLQAMDLSWRMGNDFDMPEMFPFFEEAARRSEKSLAMWRLAYNEQNFDGWAKVGNTTFNSNREIIEGAFEGEQEFDYRFLVLDEVTSGDFSMEAEISAEYGKVRFCGVVFGRKTLTDFHAAILFPPGFDDDGTAKQGYVDLSTFYGDSSFEIWRHSPIPETRDRDVSSSDNWRKLRVDITGRNVDVWLDGEFVATQEFGSLGVLRGTFGLLMGPGSARFRNVRYLARQPRDPGSLIEREIRMEGIAGAGGSMGYSWVGAKPPFPAAERWVGETRESWEEAGAVPQLLVLWSTGQNDQIRLDEWLHEVAERHSDVGLRIINVANTWDDDKLDAYLATRSFPGAVAVDKLDEEAGTGKTFQDYFINRFNLPRMLLLDIDGKVVWEGDPGFKIGRDWSAGEESYLDAPLKDLIEKRRLHDLATWRESWRTEGVEALSRGDVKAATGLLLGSRNFDWRLDQFVLDAQTRLNELEGAIASPEAFAEPLVADGREPALLALATWGELLDQPIDVDSKALKPYRRTDAARDWTKAMTALKSNLKKIEDGKEVGSMERVYEKLAPLSGPFPRELADTLRAAEASGPADLRRALLEAEHLPALWLAQEHLGW
ncbi:MAG: family 16 glycoside hydrolase [Planctomycetota bacterium]